MDIAKLQLIKANLERDRREIERFPFDLDTPLIPMFIRLNQEVSNLIMMLLEEN